MLALVDDRDHQIVDVNLQLIERLQRRRGMRLAHEIEQALQQAEPTGAAAVAKIACYASDRRSEKWKDEQALEDVVAVVVEEGFLIVGQISERARMHHYTGVFVG